jgi:hypothetical protein
MDAGQAAQVLGVGLALLSQQRQFSCFECSLSLLLTARSLDSLGNSGFEAGFLLLGKLLHELGGWGHGEGQGVVVHQVLLHQPLEVASLGILGLEGSKRVVPSKRVEWIDAREPFRLQAVQQRHAKVGRLVFEA